MSSNENDLAYWVALARLPKLGPKGFALLRQNFSTMKQAWQANVSEFKKAGLDNNLIQAIIDHRSHTDVAVSWQEIINLKIKIITIADDHYPKLLKEIFSPPPILFAQGQLEILTGQCLAIVGSRQASTYGLSMARELASDLARAGLVIISGLAYGIDAAAHQGALEDNGKTAAVMASGLDQIYPSANRKLARDILESGGLCLSEFPPGTPPLKQNFPFRNRIIAGLASGTLIIEAAKNSGALITAKYALDSNREVFALPGLVTNPFSAGSNELLKQGAQLVTEASDILTVFGMQTETSIKRQPLSPELLALLEKIPYEATHLETLLRQLNKPATLVISGLTLLEIKGYVKEEAGQNFRRLK